MPEQEEHRFHFEGRSILEQKSISLRKQEIKFMHILKEMSFVCYGPFHTIHLHPGFSSFPCLKTSTQSNHLHPFPCSHNCTLFHNALSVVSPPPPPPDPFPAPHPRSSKVQRIHTNERLFKKNKKQQDKDPYCKMLEHSSEPEWAG